MNFSIKDLSPVTSVVNCLKKSLALKLFIKKTFLIAGRNVNSYCDFLFCYRRCRFLSLTSYERNKQDHTLNARDCQ